MKTGIITPVSYEQAAKLSNKKIATVRSAADRGILTRVPSVGLVQQVVKEQVELFANKKQLRLSMLTPQELEKWQEINKAVSQKATQEPAHNRSYTPQDVAQLLAIYEEKRESLTSEEKKSSSPRSETWESSPSWITLHNSIKELSSAEITVFLAIILLIVGVCILVYAAGKKSAAETFMVDTALEQAKRYTEQPEVIVSMVSEITEKAGTPEQAIPLLLDAVEQLRAA